MSVGWSGADPTPFSDGPAADYELGTKEHANADISVTHVRVWGGPTSTAFAGRRARVWSAAGAQQAIAVLPDQLLPGWNPYPLDVAVNVPAGTDFWVSYSALDTYGAVATPGYPVPSADGMVTATSGGLHANPGTFPGSGPVAQFYGIDVVYEPGAGNQRPLVGVAAAATAALTARATLTISDETPAGVSYVIEWGDGATTSTATLGPHTHVYAAPGTYPVLVTATDAGGLTDSAVAIVTVVDPPGDLHPTSELVAVAWLKQVLGLPNSVATTLPKPAADGTISWAGTGFVQVGGVGGSPDLYVPVRQPALGISCWAVNPSSGKPPWGKANQLGEDIVAACYGSNWRLPTSLFPPNYRGAHVQNARCTEPQRLPSDEGSYARYTLDLFLDWVEVSA